MSPSAIGRWLMVLAIVVVLATVVAAIFAMGTPAAQRQVRLDDRRLDDLDKLTDAMNLHFQSLGRQPANLAELARKPGVHLSVADPVTGNPYGFASTGSNSFRLCADFTTSTSDTPSFRQGWKEERWNHGRGRQCFDRNVEKSNTK